MSQSVTRSPIELFWTAKNIILDGCSTVVLKWDSWIEYLWLVLRKLITFCQMQVMSLSGSNSCSRLSSFADTAAKSHQAPTPLFNAPTTFQKASKERILHYALCCTFHSAVLIKVLSTSIILHWLWLNVFHRNCRTRTIQTSFNSTRTDRPYNVQCNLPTPELTD